MNKRNLQIPLFFSILLLATSTLNVLCDDQVTITIQMSGNAYVTITNENGTIIFNYNGENIMPELLEDVDWLKIRVNSNQLAIELMRRDFNSLIKALNATFKDLYGKVYFLAHVTGITNGNSTVTLRLRSGNMTLADFIEQLFNTTENLAQITNKHELQIRKIKLEIASNKQEVKDELARIFKWIQENREYFTACITKINMKLADLDERLNYTSSSLSNLEKGVVEIANVTERQAVQISNLKNETSSIKERMERGLKDLSEQIAMNREDFMKQMKETNARIDATQDSLKTLAKNTNMTFTRLSNSLEAIQEYQRVSRQSTLLVLACLGVFNLVLAVLVIWMATWGTKKHES